MQQGKYIMKLFVAAAMLAAVVAQPAFAQDEAPSSFRDGLRIEARAVYETPTISSVAEDDDIYKLGSAVAFGGELGFDIAVSDQLVVGPYATYEISSVKNCEDGACVQAEDNYAIGVHAGLVAGDDGTIYLKLGYSSLGLKASVGSASNTERGNGFGGAIGYEHLLTRNIYARAEIGYADNGDIWGYNFQRRHAGLALGARF